MIPEPPTGQPPIDPSGAFRPPSPPNSAAPGSPPPMPTMPPMPPGMMPPMVFMPRPPRSFTRAVFTTLATTVLSMSLLMNAWFLLTSGRGEQQTQQVVVTEGDANQKVAIIPIRGVLARPALLEFERYLKMVRADAGVKAIVLEVDSPGGLVSTSDEIHRAVEQLKKARNLTVAVSMGSVAASGGYYVSCAADHIVATRSTLTGSIGVIFPRMNVSQMTEKWGVVEDTITAPADSYKNAGSPFRKPSDKERAYFQALIDHSYKQFTGIVAGARGNKVNIPQVADGRIFSADDAKSSGLIDQIGYLDDAIAWAISKAALSRPTVVRYRQPPSILGSLLGGDEDASSRAATIEIGGAKVQVSRELLDDLLHPRPMYLWRGY